MVDVPRRTLPNDPTNPAHQNERVRNVVEGMNPRSGRGGSRWPAPVFRREVAQAGARGIGSRATQVERHHIQGWAIIDDATDSFTLDFLPSSKSWNLMLNGVRVHRDEFTIEVQTLTILDPADLFLGADEDPDDPWDLEIQYDYVAGVLAVPSGIAAFVDAASIGGFTGSLVGGPIPTHTAGNLLVVAVSVFEAISVPAPSGWTLQSSHVGTPGLFIFTKPGDGVESSWSVAAGGTWYESVCLAYEDATFGAADETAGSGSSHNTPGISGAGTFLHFAASLAAVVPPVIGGTMRRDNSQTGSSPYVNAHETPTGSPLTYSAGSSTAWASATVRI